MKLAMFRWKDASLHGQLTKWPEDVDDFKLITLISAGLVVREDDDKITLCMDWDCEHESWRTTATYPKIYFEEIQYIEIPKRIAWKKQ